MFDGCFVAAGSRQARQSRGGFCMGKIRFESKGIGGVEQVRDDLENVNKSALCRCGQNLSLLSVFGFLVNEGLFILLLLFTVFFFYVGISRARNPYVNLHRKASRRNFLRKKLN